MTLVIFKKNLSVVLAIPYYFCCAFIITSCGNYYFLVSPDYYRPHLIEKIEEIKQIADENEIAKSFFFITDLHWEGWGNTQNSPALMHDIKSYTNIDTVVMGGDYTVYDYYTKEEVFAIVDDCMSSFSEFERYAIIGNHETNTANYHPPGSVLPEFIDSDEMNPHINFGLHDKTYYAIDDAQTRFRNIFLDTNNFLDNPLQQQFLTDALLSLDESWTAMIFMHIYNNYAYAGNPIQIDSNGEALDALLMGIKPQIKCSVAGIFSGHTHRDFFGVNQAGYPVLSTTCDAINVYDYLDDAYVREHGKYTEQAFDVIQIDLNQRKVFLTRIGAGIDRSYTY